MITNRVIVQLLINNGKLIKTKRFGESKYIGDPLNAVKIFNEKGVDELVITDMTATNKGINFELITNMVTEAFMPVCYSGGIKGVADAKKLFKLGVEKICLTSAAITDKARLKTLVETYGSQSIVVNINIKKNIFGRLKIFDAERGKLMSLSLSDPKSMSDLQVGELILWT